VHEGLRENHKGMISVDMIVNTLRGELSGVRSALIDQVYDKL